MKEKKKWSKKDLPCEKKIKKRSRVLYDTSVTSNKSGSSLLGLWMRSPYFDAFRFAEHMVQRYVQILNSDQQSKVKRPTLEHTHGMHCKRIRQDTELNCIYKNEPNIIVNLWLSDVHFFNWIILILDEKISFIIKIIDDLSTTILMLQIKKIYIYIYIWKNRN